MAFSKAVLAAVALTLVQSTAAWNVQQPPCPDKFTPFKYNACYDDSASANALIYRSTSDTKTMTVEKCQAECKGTSFPTRVLPMLT